MAAFYDDYDDENDAVVIASPHLARDPLAQYELINADAITQTPSYVDELGGGGEDNDNESSEHKTTTRTSVSTTDTTTTPTHRRHQRRVTFDSAALAVERALSDAELEILLEHRVLLQSNYRVIAQRVPQNFLDSVAEYFMFSSDYFPGKKMLGVRDWSVIYSQDDSDATDRFVAEARMDYVEYMEHRKDIFLAEACDRSNLVSLRIRDRLRIDWAFFPALLENDEFFP